RAHVTEPDVGMRHGMKPNVFMRHPLFLQELLDRSLFLLFLDHQVYLYVPRECPDYFDLNVLERPVLDILDRGPSHPDGLMRFPLTRKGKCGINRRLLLDLDKRRGAGIVVW